MKKIMKQYLMSNVQLFAFVDDARTVQTECRELALC